MKEEFDVAIVGGGPAGVSAACVLAEKGIKAILFERGEYCGSKNVSGGVLYGHDLAALIPDFPERNCPVERNIVESRLWYLSRNGGYTGFPAATQRERANQCLSRVPPQPSGPHRRSPYQATQDCCWRTSG